MRGMMQILHSKQYGEAVNGTPLLVIHGLFGMLDNWGGFAREVADEFRTHLLDLRNHGKSFHSDEMSHDAMADDILHYMNHYGIDKAYLLGHSLGGKAVMQFALKYPERVQKLIVVDIAPKAYPPHHQANFKALNSVDFTKVSTRQEVEAQLSEYINEKPVVQFLCKNLYWKEDKTLAWRFNLKTLEQKYNDFVANAIKYGVFEGDTLFIAGEKSHYILPQDAFLIKQQFPKSKIVSIKDAGHWVQADNMQDFVAEVRHFLAEG